MLSVGLCAAVLILVVVVMGKGLRWLHQTRQATVAQTAARDLLERVKQSGRSALPGDGTYDGATPTSRSATSPPFPPDPYPSFSEDGRQYTVRVDLSTIRPGLRAVRVDVRWDGNHSVTYETFIH